MSYVVQVWDQPAGVTLPGSLDAAVALLDQLQQQPAWPAASERFARLAEQLQRRFPATAGRPVVWSGGALAPAAEAAVWPIGLARSDRLDDVQALIVARATALGLHVLDEQAGEAHLADGRVFSLGPRGPCVKGFAARLDGDHASALAEFRHLAAEGNRPARYALAEAYLQGLGLRQNTVVGCALLCAATGWRAGPLVAAHAPRDERDAAIGRRVREQVGSTACAAADQLLRRFDSHPGGLLAAIDACCSDVDLRFGDAEHALARGDEAGALRLLGPLADQGHEIAQHRLAGLIAAGRGAAPDPVLAARWTQRAAKGGHVPAQLALARLYEDGDVLEQDLLLAERWYRSAAAAGDAEAADALDRMLGRHPVPPGGDAHGHYLRGNEAEAAGDFAAAAQHHAEAARHAHAGARHALGRLHRRGHGVPRDDAQAALWFELAAEQGIADAQYALACMHHDGIGVPKNAMKAWQWFGHAANQLHAEALAALGTMAGEGIAVERDLVAAKALSLLAERRGAPARVPLRFAPGERDEVQALVEALVAAPSVTGALGARRRRQREAAPRHPRAADVPADAPIRRWHPGRTALLATGLGVPVALLMKAGAAVWLLLLALGVYGLHGMRALRRSESRRAQADADSAPG